MSIREIFMPALSSTMTEGKIVSWEKAAGDKVEKGETVVIVESDKADMDVESFYEGYMAHILVEAGGTAPVGSTIALLTETEAEIETAIAQAKSHAAPAKAVAAATGPGQIVAPEPASVGSTNSTAQNGSSRTGRTIASPRARKLAKEFKVDLSGISGSGPHGRIIAEDVETAAGNTVTTPPQPAIAPAHSTPTVTPAATPTPMPVAVTPGQTVPLTTLQNAVVRTMLHSLSVPTFHVGYTIASDELNKLYKQIKSKGVTMTALLAKAVAMTLQKHPLLNTNYSEQGMVHPSNINIAVAVAMDDGGLITPVLQNADQQDIYSLSRNWKSLVERARAKQLQPQEYSSGTFTISNLGMFGVDTFDAILPPGQGSILAIAASRPEVVATADGMMGIRTLMKVNITCDHRVIYGAHAAAFLQDLAKLIETNSQSLTM
ncbi:dihydrolipoamide acetyltransferase family protein [Rivularia sp. UHCC 0363]|uniref:dihydrolipoamide acetyltransferase family protein n=1 Tax=Rivularia sp. UHCC 0363 TaxID=3110244 RepID=UPI002B20D076|nr:dihydrolipoamide acetyltransferase family protein [Rivularia sp. UHCC 0363]MEA5597043.1 dihydrolipoamide acetyltransferase family protein [Rivularia sp. UHCC 0363]